MVKSDHDGTPAINHHGNPRLLLVDADGRKGLLDICEGGNPPAIAGGMVWNAPPCIPGPAIPIDAIVGWPAKPIGCCIMGLCMPTADGCIPMGLAPQPALGMMVGPGVTFGIVGDGLRLSGKSGAGSISK